MRTLRDYLCEGIFDTSEDALPCLYHPKNRDELKERIRSIVSNHKKDKIIDLNCIDTSQITDMHSLFYDEWIDFINLTAYNYNISNWDVSNVKDMSYMFGNCKNFNGDLSKWNVRNVKMNRDIFWQCPLEKNRNSKYKKIGPKRSYFCLKYIFIKISKSASNYIFQYTRQ